MDFSVPKKLYFGIALILFIAVLAVFFLTVPENRESHASLGEIKTGYVYDRGNDKATLTLYSDSNKCDFTTSMLSSYFAVGTYKENKSYLIMNTDDGENIYTFKKDNGNLIFIADKSSGVPKYVYSKDAKPEPSVPDKAVFKKINSKSD